MRKRQGDMRLKQQIAKQYYNDPQNLYEYCARCTCTPHPHTRKHTPNRHIIAQT